MSDFVSLLAYRELVGPWNLELNGLVQEFMVVRMDGSTLTL